MTTFGLIRHGITDWNDLGKAQGISDIPLNENGREQAFLIGGRLMNEGKWDLIATSDLSRAGETAQIIGSALNIPINQDARLREINCGEIEGTTEEYRLQTWGKNWRDIVKGMEKYEEVGRRGKEALRELVNTYPGQRILIVSHGALIGLTLQHLLPMQFPETYIDNTSLTILKYMSREWNCPLYNCTAHLT
ncbi:histidine phosphatase family protein [Rossellomorea aquimaris]|uniref:histidine phosphatase family protein n=1 Tax=Rossellomorea TaxID=2837508 RepID=UPI001CD1E5FC|nr:histidine phosphatase family protein [Rossellomorea aquimaris]MCA1060514.1 histidine phosphatase family protein [Rossellomorea aquimaris]